jgi:hypothetical protein
VVDAWPLKVNTYSAAALGGKNVQKDADIHLFVAGVERPDLLQLTHL